MFICVCVCALAYMRVVYVCISLYVYVLYVYHACAWCCYSDPYVKISFRGPIRLFPHFTTFGNDPVPDFYKTQTILKVKRQHYGPLYISVLLIDIEPKLECWF